MEHRCEVPSPVWQSGGARRAKFVSIMTKNGRADSVHAGLAQLFRLLTPSVDRSHSLGPVTTAGCSLAPVENTRCRRAALVANGVRTRSGAARLPRPIP